MPNISVVIPTFNRAPELLATLKSLENQTYQDFEVVVADDGSKDNTKEIAGKKFSFPVQYVYQKNGGRAAARNMGIAKAKGPIILFIDDHIIVDEKLLEEHVKTHEKLWLKGVEVVRGRVEYIKTPDNAPKKPKKPKKKFFWPFEEQSPFITFITNNISVTKAALDLCGGFDPDFKEYGFQDQELGWRLRQRGVRFKINQKAVGHIFGVTSIDTEKRLDKFRQAGRSAVLFYRKHPLGGAQIGVNPFNVLIQKIASFNNNWLYRRYRLRMEKYAGNNQKKFDKWFYKLRGLYFLDGIVEGFVKYPPKSVKQRTGKNVVMLVSHQSDLSGAPISLVILANRLAQFGYIPVLVLPEKGPIIKRIQPHVRVAYIKGPSKYVGFTKLVAAFRPTIIHANTFLTEYALDVAKVFGIKTIMHVREDLRQYPAIPKRLSDKADRLILISNSMIGEYPDPLKLDVIYNAIEAVPAEAGLAPVEEPYSILFVGTLEKRKGVIDLLQAVRLVYADNKRVRLHILGKPLGSEMGYYRSLQRYVKKQNMSDYVHFDGVTDTINDFLDRTSLVVVPSHAEPFGRVVIEAMARKKIVIGTSVGGIPEIIEQYVNGFLVKPSNPAELAKTIMYVWTKSDEQKQSIKEKAYITVKEKFLADGYVKNVVRAYEKLFKEIIELPLEQDYYRREKSGPVRF
jgi:glycosyltransferase involved in cell wall biosynthesis